MKTAHDRDTARGTRQGLLQAFFFCRIVMLQISILLLRHITAPHQLLPHLVQLLLIFAPAAAATAAGRANHEPWHDNLTAPAAESDNLPSVSGCVHLELGA